MGKRYWEIDVLRGVAVISMIAFHVLFDLNYFSIIEYSPSTFFAYIIASLFLLLVGISYTISYNRDKKWKHHIKRGLKVFGWGIIITLITWITFPKNVILFGILHLIGLSIIIAYPLIKYKQKNLILGFVILLTGIFLFPIIKPPFPTFDFFPILPWTGIILIGMYIGHQFYPKGKRTFKIVKKPNIIFEFFSVLGRNSLLIYLLHQPLLIAFIIVLMKF